MVYFGQLYSMVPPALFTYGIILTVINIGAFFLMGIDKLHAVREKRRIPEATLMTIAALGGAVGILLGMVIFKHKTSKVKFYWGVPILYLLNKLMHLTVFLWISK